MKKTAIDWAVRMTRSQIRCRTTANYNLQSPKTAWINDPTRVSHWLEFLGCFVCLANPAVMCPAGFSRHAFENLDSGRYARYRRTNVFLGNATIQLTIPGQLDRRARVSSMKAREFRETCADENGNGIPCFLSPLDFRMFY